MGDTQENKAYEESPDSQTKKKATELKPEQKISVALEALVGDLTATRTAEAVASKYSEEFNAEISAECVSQWKNQVFAAVRSCFKDSASPKIDYSTVSHRISELLKDKPKSNQGKKLGKGTSSKKTDIEVSEKTPIERVVSCLMKWNEGEGNIPIYISKGIIQRFSGHSVSEVDKYLDDNKKKIDDFNSENNLDSDTNKKIKNLSGLKV